MCVVASSEWTLFHTDVLEIRLQYPCFEPTQLWTVPGTKKVRYMQLRTLSVEMSWKIRQLTASLRRAGYGTSREAISAKMEGRIFHTVVANVASVFDERHSTAGYRGEGYLKRTAPQHVSCFPLKNRKCILLKLTVTPPTYLIQSLSTFIL